MASLTIRSGRTLRILDCTCDLVQNTGLQLNCHPSLGGVRKRTPESLGELRRKPKSSVIGWLTDDDHKLFPQFATHRDAFANERTAYSLMLPFGTDSERCKRNGIQRTARTTNGEFAEENVPNRLTLGYCDQGSNDKAGSAQAINEDRLRVAHASRVMSRIA